MLFLEKSELRNHILKRLRTQKEEVRLLKSLNIQKKLFNLPEFQAATTILFYASFDGEVDTSGMIKEAQKIGKKIGLPKVNRDKNYFIPTLVEYLDKELEIGAYGIKEPIATEGKVLSLEDIDMVIVPGVAFDKRNQRLGRGKGYYDHFLKALPPSTPTIGLAFDFQVVEALSFNEPHDIPVSHVLYN